MPELYLLFETASGYSLLEVLGLDELGTSSLQVQQAVNDLARFSKVVPVNRAIMAIRRSINSFGQDVTGQGPECAPLRNC